MANKIDKFIKENIHEIIYDYYQQLTIILAPNALNDFINNTATTDDDIYFHLIIIYGFCRMIMKIKLIPDICYIIFDFYYGPDVINGTEFQSWANALAATDGVIIAYSKGRPYYNQTQSLDPFMVKYEQYLAMGEIDMVQFGSDFNRSIEYEYEHEYEQEYEHEYEHEYGHKYGHEYGHKYEINYSSFKGLYCDKMLYLEPVDEINEQQLLCTKYDQYKYEIFMESQHISCTYYRWAAIVFDIIWSIIWCL